MIAEPILAEHLRIEHEIREGALDRLRVHVDVTYGLRADPGDVVRECHRHRAHVLRDGERVEGAGLALGRKNYALHAAAQAGHVAELLLPQLLEEVVDDGKDDTQMLRQVVQRRLAEEVRRLQRELLEDPARDPGLGRGPRWVDTPHRVPPQPSGNSEMLVMQ